MATSVAAKAEEEDLLAPYIVSRTYCEGRAPMRLLVNMGKSGKAQLFTYTTRESGGGPKPEEIEIREGDILLLRTVREEYFRIICDKKFLLSSILIKDIADLFLACPQSEINVTSLPERLRRMLGEHASMVCNPECWESLVSIWPTNAQSFKQFSAR